MDNVIVFHAGTKRDDQGRFVTNGGRVLAVTGLGDTLKEARDRAYAGAGLITFQGSIRRSDIALSRQPRRAVIPRYAPKDVAELFSDETRFDTMLEVELLAADALAELGVLPAADAAALRARRPVIDADFVMAVNEREETTNHDTAAFVDVVQERIGMPEGAWVHFGLTSSDVVDTALCYCVTQAMDIVITEVTALRDALTRRAKDTIDTPVLGRTHGMHAEPTTYGQKFALFALQVDRDLARATRARAAIAVGKLSGAVGTYSNIDPSVEDFVCARLGLTPVPATQVIARDRHAEVLYACAAIGTSIENFATEVRLLVSQRSG